MSSTSRTQITVSDRSMTIDEVAAVAQGRSGVVLSPDATWRSRIVAGRRILEESAARGDAVYGVTTGVGAAS